MIVRNEEHNLSDCLQPVAPLVDEIVLVDTGSHDSTKRIARCFTDRVVDFAWRDDFSAARNESLRHASGDWIFWLDADDRIRPENLLRLRCLLEGLKDRPHVYFMDTLSHGQYESEGPQLQSHPRLFRRHPEMHWKNRVHEQLRPNPESLGHEVVWTDIQIDHLGYQSPALLQRKLRRNIRLLAMDYAIDPTDSSTLFHLGMAYATLENHAEARRYLRRLVAADTGACDCMERVYRALAELSLTEGDFDGSLRILSHGLSKYPGHEGLLYLQASYLFQLGRYDEARIALEQVMAGTTTREHSDMPCDIKGKLAPRKLADVFRLQKKFHLAERTLRSVIEHYPTDTHAWYALGCVYGDTSQEAPLHAVIARLSAFPDGHIFAAVLQAAWHLERGRFEPARILIDRLISEAPDVPLPRVLRCQWLDRVGASSEARRQACRDLLRVQPGNPEALAALQRLENAQCLVSRPLAADSQAVVVGCNGPNEFGPASIEYATF
jgi:glycosyltransferase involved in cell wall biosynthesis